MKQNTRVVDVDRHIGGSGLKGILDIPHVEAVEASESVAGVVLGKLNDAIFYPGWRTAEQVERGV